MSQLGDLVRFALNSPFPPFLFFLSIVFLFQRQLVAWWRRGSEKSTKLALAVFFGAVLAGYAVIVLVYLFSTIYLDPISPSIISISWLFARGAPMYHAINANVIYSLLYGPAAYFVNGLFMKVLGPSIFSSKLASVLSLLLTFVLLYATLKKFLQRHNKILFFGLIAALFLVFWTFSFEARPDVMSLFWVAFGLWATTLESPAWATLLVGVALGMSINLKIDALFYFPPILLLFWHRFKLKPVLLSLLVGVVVVFTPFVIFTNISLHNYLIWLAAASRHPLDFASFENNILYTLLLLVPFAFILLQPAERAVGHAEKRKFEGWYLKITFVSMLIVSVFASKAGSGQNHLLPFVPLLLYGYALWRGDDFLRVRHDEAEIKLAWLILVPFLLTLLFFAYANLARVARLYYVYPRGAAANVEAIIKAYPGEQIAMGYSASPGSNLNLTTNLPSMRPLLVFAGNTDTIDQAALGDLEESGAQLAPSFLQNFSQCNDDIWLFPRGTQPFVDVLGYGQPMFSAAFQQSFLSNYKLERTMGYYDLWGCTGAGK